MKGTGAKRNVCPGSCVSTGAKLPVAPVESAPMTPDHSDILTQYLHCVQKEVVHLLLNTLRNNGSMFKKHFQCNITA